MSSKNQGNAQKARDSARAAYLKASGVPHGKRQSKGLTNVPNRNDVGSAAYRRRMR